MVHLLATLEHQLSLILTFIREFRKIKYDKHWIQPQCTSRSTFLLYQDLHLIPAGAKEESRDRRISQSFARS